MHGVARPIARMPEPRLRKTRESDGTDSRIDADSAE
jgi:hypothetical protein